MNFGNLKYIEIEAYKVKDNVTQVFDLILGNDYTKENRETLKKLNAFRVIRSLKVITDKFTIYIKPNNDNMKYDLSHRLTKYLTTINLTKEYKVTLDKVIPLIDEFRVNKTKSVETNHLPYHMNELWRWGIREEDENKKYYPINYIEYVLNNKKGDFSKCFCMILKFNNKENKALLNDEPFNMIKIQPNRNVWSFNEKKGNCLLYRIEKNNN